MRRKPEKVVNFINAKAFYFALVLIAIVSSTTFGQSITWQRIIDNNYSNYNKVIETRDNHILAIGFDKINTINYLVISKFDMYGNEIWHKIIGNGNSEGEWIEETNDNSYIVCGSTYFENIRRIYLVKTDTSGTIIWENNYHYSDVNNAYCVKESNDNGFIVAGMTFPTNVGIYLLKTDSNGNILKQKILLNNFQQQIYEIVEMNGFFWGVGYSSINNVDLLVLKLDYILDTVKTRTFGGSKTDGGYALTHIGKDRVLLGGVSNSYNINEIYEPYIINLDTNLEPIWQKTFPSNYNELFKSIIYKPGFGIIAAGSMDSIGNISKAKLRLVDINGNLLKEKGYLPGTLGAGFESVSLSSDNGVIAAGFVTYSGAFEKMYVIKTDSVLYAEPIGLVNINAKIPEASALFQNYPNPFNPTTKIKFQIPLFRGVSEGQLVTPGREGMFTNISIYDISGRLVKTILQQNIKPGSYEITFDGTGLSSGVYFYKLVTNGFTDAKKMMLVK
ncbi:MAG TPA: T9SS type A sorting domain-containing protein [Ignavibacteria bacterium]|nr:T9SS type A sorting domain-containing protein [Ignavibacteria bacterium]